MAKAPASSTPAPATPEAPEAPAVSKPSLLGRVLAPLLKLRQQPVRAALLGVPVAIIGGAVLCCLLFFGKRAEKATLERALAKLEAQEYADARRIAAEVRTGAGESFSNVGGAFFILGAVMVEDAQEHQNSHERQTLYLIASRYLEEARIRGFPPGHEKDGLLLLGRSLHHGGRFPASIPILKEALPQNPDAKGEILYLLADSYLHLSPPNPEQAFTHARRLLAEKHLPQAERDNGLLLQGKIALAQGKYDDGRKALEKIDPKSSAHTSGVLFAVRLLCEELKDSAAKLSPSDQARLEKSLQSLANLGQHSRVTAEHQAQAELLTAVCLELLGKTPEASAAYARVRKIHFGSPEAVAAAFFVAERLLQNGQAEEAVSLYKQGLSEAGPAETYHNDWLPRKSLETRLPQAIQTLLTANQFAEAGELAAALTPIVPAEQAYFWRAKVEHEWGAQLLAKGANGHSPRMAQTPQNSQHQARGHLSKAGAHFERLAELRIATRFYLDDLLDSARDYLAGQSYSRAIRVLRTFLNEDPSSGEEEARVSLGEALLAVGQTDEGLRCWRKP